MSNDDLNEVLNESLTRWVALSGTGDLSQTRFTVDGSKWNSHYLHELLVDFDRTRDLDPSGLTTLMLLRDTVRTYMREHTASAYDIITRHDEVVASVSPMRYLWGLLESEIVRESIDAYRTTILAAYTHYGVVLDDNFRSWLDEEGLSVLRRDALRSMQTLRLHQFTRGVSDPEPLRYNPKVVGFWNVNSLLAALRSQRLSGITLVLIRDPAVPTFSYFCFAVRDGETISILTDAPNVPHPDFKHMTRRPDRNLRNRAEQHWFPYDLLDLEQDEAGRLRQSNGIVPVNAEAIHLRDLRDLHPASVLWVTLVFDLLRQRLQVEGLRTKSLSYTGEMVRVPEALVDGQSALVRTGLYEPLVLPAIRNDDVGSSTVPAGDFAVETGFNAWMIERYGHQVPESVLNPVGESEVRALLPTVETGDLAPLKGRFNEVKGLTLNHLDPTSFGTREQIQRDRVWVARKNQAHVIQRLADEEFVRERENILSWYAERVASNAEMLYDAAARRSLVGPTFRARRMTLWPPRRELFPTQAAYDLALAEYVRDSTDNPEVGELLSVRRHHAIAPDVIFVDGSAHVRTGPLGAPRSLVTGEPLRGGMHCCERPDVVATVHTWIRPGCPEAVALVCGVTVDDLPWALRHWYMERPHHGNSILDRVDPADYVLRNPWAPDGPGRRIVRGIDQYDPLNLIVSMWHSKSALNARRKALGLPRTTWE